MYFYKQKANLSGSTVFKSRHTIAHQNKYLIPLKPVSSLRYKSACAYSKDSNQFAYLHNLISLGFPPEEMLDPWLPIESPSKTDQTAWMRRMI